MHSDKVCASERVAAAAAAGTAAVYSAELMMPLAAKPGYVVF